MGFQATSSGGGDFEQPNPGNYPAVCVQVIDLGLQETEYLGVKKMTHKCIMAWELPDQLMEDGRPFMIKKWYTVTTSEMGNLRPDMESWRGKAFTQPEIDSFEVTNVAGVPCLLNCVSKPKQNGSARVVVSGIAPLPASMVHLVGSPHNPIQVFSVQDYNNGDADAQAAYENLTDWYKKTINLTGQASDAVYELSIGKDREGSVSTIGDLAQEAAPSENPAEGQEEPFVDSDLPF